MTRFHLLTCPEYALLAQKMSAVPRSRQVCCSTQQTWLRCHTADMLFLCDTADSVCCVTQQTCLLCVATVMSAV